MINLLLFGFLLLWQLLWLLLLLLLLFIFHFYPNPKYSSVFVFCYSCFVFYLLPCKNFIAYFWAGGKNQSSANLRSINYALYLRLLCCCCRCCHCLLSHFIIIIICGRVFFLICGRLCVYYASLLALPLNLFWLPLCAHFSHLFSVVFFFLYIICFYIFCMIFNIVGRRASLCATLIALTVIN